LRIRTVLDARPDASPSYLRLTLLLAHSWAAQSGTSPLEVVVVGPAPSALVERLREIGVDVTSSGPHPVEPVRRNANKLLGLRASGDAPVLLVDNDVLFLEDVSDLEGRNVRASAEFMARISEAHWERIAAATGLRPLEMEWIPPTEEVKAKWSGRAPRPLQQLSLNSGVVWIREPVAFEVTWAAHIGDIARAFDGHPLNTQWVRGDDQVGLITAAAEHGGFDLLPLTYNCRPVCIRLGLMEPKILHLTRLGVAELVPFSKGLTAFWDRRVLARIGRESKRSPLPGADAERERLLDEAVSLRDRVLRLGAEADLDTFNPGERTAR
jgi:hypothetical protein